MADLRLGAPDAVLLDDDVLVQMTWKISARNANKILRIYSRVEDLRTELDSLPKGVFIYIDSSLGGQIRGEEFAREIHAAGFGNIYLVTGFPVEHFEMSKLPHIRGVLGKEPVW